MIYRRIIFAAPGFRRIIFAAPGFRYYNISLLFLHINHSSFIVNRVQSILTMQYVCVCMYMYAYFVYLHVQINLTRVEIWEALRYVHKCTSMFMYTCVDVFMYICVCAWVGVYIGVSTCACMYTCMYVLHYSY